MVKEQTLDFSKFTITSDSNCIKVNDTIMKVVPDYEFTYKLQKTQIRASGGAEGLATQVNKWIEDSQCSDATLIGTLAFAPHFAVWASSVINHVLKNGQRILF